ncbi:hypothetical protein Acr_11g0007120 [Actinidia rufa]|uniref:Uncharacterized protein n=1 Tax=Actinidia rufa TaxID=165716 RepID=A0A7J0FD96_9ERIC|nr:hypothetical protein Acr_11g0007120 [Actinidia rufa]
MMEADETSRFLEEATAYDSAEVMARNWMANGEMTKYLETTTMLWSLVDEAKERSTELESSAEVEKRPVL